jgi:hypothetical protein
MPPQLIVVTAASSNHAGALRQMLISLQRLRARVECYDLGLTAREVEALPDWSGLTYHKFDYSAFPAHLDVEVNAGEYAWKPVIVAAVIDRVRTSNHPTDVLWADAGCYFHAVQPIAERITLSGGLWIRRSQGLMRDWTHPKMFTYLGADASKYGDMLNTDATMVGFGTGSAAPAAREALYRNIVAPWKACALAKDCIAPAGSSRANHRQDQAVLSYLVHRGGYPLAADTRQELCVRCKCDRWFYHYVGFGVPPSVYWRTCLS